MITFVRFLIAVSLTQLLAGCISFNTSDAPVPEYVNACSNHEQQCRDICGNTGVQAYNCSAKPGEGINFKCECRKPGTTL